MSRFVIFFILGSSIWLALSPLFSLSLSFLLPCPRQAAKQGRTPSSWSTRLLLVSFISSLLLSVSHSLSLYLSIFLSLSQDRARSPNYHRRRSTAWGWPHAYLSHDPPCFFFYTRERKDTKGAGRAVVWVFSVFRRCFGQSAQHKGPIITGCNIIKHASFVIFCRFLHLGCSLSLHQLL